MSLFAVTLAGEIRAARAALHRAGIETHPLWLAVNHASACVADLERAERLLDSERSSAEAARAALDRAAQLFEIEAEQQRRAEEADQQEAAALAAVSGSSAARGYMPSAEGCAEFAADQQAAEIERLRKTLALAAEAIREADTLRSTAQPGEEIEDTRRRWEDAGCIEMAAVACRKAARKALASLTVFADKRSPAQQAAAVEATRTAALSLKAAIDHYRERDQRLRASKKGGAK